MKNLSCLLFIITLTGCDSFQAIDLKATFKDEQGNKETCEVHAYGFVSGIEESYKKCKQDLISKGYKLISEEGT